MEDIKLEEDMNTDPGAQTEEAAGEETFEGKQEEEKGTEQEPEAGDASGSEGTEIEIEDAQDGAEEEPEKEGFFKKKKKDKKEEASKAKIEELEDRVKRQMAEFENFRKRTDKEKAAMFETGARSVIEKILPVVDNFERGLATVKEEDRENPFVDGMNKVYKQLMTELDNMGVKPIEAAGQEFDPNLHNAVMHVEDENYGENIVAEEFQKGYTYHDVVVRHSMVKVAN